MGYNIYPRVAIVVQLMGAGEDDEDEFGMDDFEDGYSEDDFSGFDEYDY